MPQFIVPEITGDKFVFIIEKAVLQPIKN